MALGLIVGDATMGLAAGAATALALRRDGAFAACSRRFARRFIFFVAVTWTVAAAFASLAVASPYSARAPKRLAVLHQHDAARRRRRREIFVGAFDSVPAAAAPRRYTARRRFDQPREKISRPCTLSRNSSAKGSSSGRATRIVRRGARRRPSSPSNSHSLHRNPNPKTTTTTADRVRDVATGGDVQIARAGVELRAGTGARDGVVVVRDASEDGSVVGATRGNGDASETWTFWVETRRGDEDTVEVDAWALYPGETKETREVTEGKGEGVSVIAATTDRVETARVQM